MGKHERDWAEPAELDVANGINGEIISECLQPVVDSIVARINQQYNEGISWAEWTGGNNYNDPGDVHVHLNSQEKVKVELKFSKKTGAGTLKNPSTNILKKKIESSILNYPEFEIEYKKQRYDLIEAHVGRRPRTAHEYTKILRSLRDNNDPIIDKIAEITAPGQEAYSAYAASILKLHLAKVNDMVDTLLNLDPDGVTQQGILYCVVKHYGTAEQKVEFYEFTEMDRIVVDVESSGNSILFKNSKGKDVIRFSTTWKNICQGGATPCFNVFLGNAFQGK